MGVLWLFFPVPGMWACLLVLLACPGLWGIACFALLFVLVVPVCGLLVLFIRWFCVRAEAPFPLI